MRPVLVPIFALGLLAGASASAQSTTNCQWLGSVWTCQSTPQTPPVDWSALRSPNHSTSIMNSFQQGMQIGAQARRARQERERHEAQLELYRAQTEAARNQAQSSRPAPTPSARSQEQPPEYIRLWYQRAEPRMGLYPDFAEKVFADNVAITPGMVMLMSGSDYAADIAYYLATHQAEARAISQLHLLDAARAIDRIETKFKAEASEAE